jgi:hypothetical protein
MKPALMLVAAFGLAGPAFAQQSMLSEAQARVTGCLFALGGETTGTQCAGLMFAPCADQEVGSEGHVACLRQEQQAWQGAMMGKVSLLGDILTTDGSNELTQLMGGWINLIAQNCGEVASAKEGLAARSAELGCQISEIAGATTEFVACAEGLSTAPYCVIQE